MEALRTPNEELVCRVRLTASHPFMFVGVVHVHKRQVRLERVWTCFHVSPFVSLCKLTSNLVIRFLTSTSNLRKKLEESLSLVR